MFVLGGVGLVLASLTGAFWAYFMYLWKTWDNGKREPGQPAFVGFDEDFLDQDRSRDDLATGSDDASSQEINQVRLQFEAPSNKLLTACKCKLRGFNLKLYLKFISTGSLLLST